MRTQHTLHSLPAFPVYSAGFLSETRLVVGGGGGTGRSGIRNKLRLYDVDKARQGLTLVSEAELEPGEDAPMTIAVNAKDHALVCGANSSEVSVAKGINEHCRLYKVEDDKLILGAKKQTLPTDDLESYQNVTAFSKDYKVVAIGTSNNEVVVLSYPSLAVVSEPFKIPGGILYGLDFSDSTLLVTTSTSLHFISLPLNIFATPNDSTPPTHDLTLPPLTVSLSLPVPTLSQLSATEDGGTRTFRAARLNLSDSGKTLWAIVNSAPPSGRGRGKKVERRSWIVRYERVLAKGEKEGDEEWEVGKVRALGKRAVTVFAVSEDGKLAAYGASDSSVGIVDTKTLAPLLEILKSHDFPPTLLQFNPNASLLVSGSADASVRVILVPSFESSFSSLYIVLILALLALVAAVLMARS